MSQRLVTERVRQPDQECWCDCCGATLIIGDKLMVDLDAGRVYCGRDCASKDQDTPEYGDLCDALSLWEDRYGA